MALFTWPFPKTPSAPPLLGIMALAVAAIAAIMLAAGLLNFYGNPQARTAQAQNVAADRAALAAFYTSANGASWTTNTNWNTSAPLGDWHGVTTNASGRVTNLELPSNNLTGSIPAELGQLSELTRLLIRDNALTGSIPTELGGLSNLSILSIQGNGLTGTIPAELGQLSELTQLNLFRNNLTGSIPAQLGQLSNLTALDISENALTGTVPAQLGSLILLEVLGLDGGQLTGQLPYSLTSLTALNALRFQGNAGLCAPLDSDFRTWFQGVGIRTGDDCPRIRIRSGAGAPVVGEPVTAELTAREDRLARIKATLTEYEADPCIGYDDTRDVNNVWIWYRANSPTGTFTRVTAGKHPHASFVYTPQPDDVGKYLRGHVNPSGESEIPWIYSEAIGPVVAAHSVASGDQVTVAAPTGTLTVGSDLSVSLPDAAAAERGDPAINPRLHPWQWERSDDGSADWSNVTPYHKHCETPDSEYPLTDGDANKHLRAYIYYNDDSSGSSVLKRAETASAGPVAP